MPAEVFDQVKLKDIVLGYIELSKQTEAEFLRLWRICFNGFKFMGINAFWEPITTVLPVLSNATVVFPPDQIQWVKLGYFNQAGELATLRINKNLTTYKDNSLNRITDITDELQQVAPALLNDSWWWSSTNFIGAQTYGANGYGYCQKFGAGSHLVQPGEVRIDYENKIYVLNPQTFLTNIVLEYISSPQMNDDYCIPMQFELAMTAWLAWRDIIYLPATGHVGNNNVQMRANDFKAMLKVAKRSYKPFRLQEAYQEIIEGQNLGIKP